MMHVLVKGIPLRPIGGTLNSWPINVSVNYSYAVGNNEKCPGTTYRKFRPGLRLWRSHEYFMNNCKTARDVWKVSTEYETGCQLRTLVSVSGVPYWPNGELRTVDQIFITNNCTLIRKRWNVTKDHKEETKVELLQGDVNSAICRQIKEKPAEHDQGRGCNCYRKTTNINAKKPFNLTSNFIGYKCLKTAIISEL